MDSWCDGDAGIACSRILVLFYLGTTSDHGSDGALILMRQSPLKQGGVVFLGTFFAAIYLKVDQIMLKMLKGDAEVGVYAVAATVSEAFISFR